MSKDIGQIYKHSQSQILTSSFKVPVSSSSETQKSSAIKFKATSVASITYKHQNNSIFCSQKTTQNDATIKNNDDMDYCETQKTKFNISTISTPNHYSRRISSTSSSISTSNIPTLLPLVGKEYMCFMKEDKSDQAARCIKSRTMTKVIDSVLSIDTFEQQCVVLKGMLKSLRLKYHLQTIGIHLSLRNNSIYEHKYLENIKKLYK